MVLNQGGLFHHFLAVDLVGLLGLLGPLKVSLMNTKEMEKLLNFPHSL